jgi:hypothetical protein
MVFADVLNYLLLVLAAVAVFISYWLASSALMPALVSQAREAYSTSPIRITLLGVLVGLPPALFGLALLKTAPEGGAKLVGAVIVSVPLLLALVGSAGLSERIGRGLIHADDTRSPWRRSLRGAVVLSLTFILPFIGWFVVMPLALFSGLGATLVALWARRRARHMPLLKPM